MLKNNVVADLSTAQNSMFSFVADALDETEKLGLISSLAEDGDQLSMLYHEVRQQLLQFLAVPDEKQSSYHIGVVDSGKRAIETLVNYFCPPEEKVNVLVNTENYVAFNKFSAAEALRKQKGVEFLQPFTLKMGQALTIDSDTEMEKAKLILRTNKVKTLWLAWNSTSTGVKEKVEELVAYRNECNSITVIICDSASLPLFSKSWLQIDTENLPDIFFFSLRKQGLPYSGPQDEAHQARNSGALYIFNDRALHLAAMVKGESLYDTPTPLEASLGVVTQGEQRENHIRHLLKLNISLSVFLDNSNGKLNEVDSTRQTIAETVRRAFNGGGVLASHGFSLLTSTSAQSDTTYVVKVPENIQPKELVKCLKEKGIYFSISMHPEVPNSSYFRFSCYPATTIAEVQQALHGIETCFPQTLRTIM